MKIVTFKQYLGNYSGSQEVDVCIDKILCVYDNTPDRNKATIFLTEKFSIPVANTRARL